MFQREPDNSSAGRCGAMCLLVVPRGVLPPPELLDGLRHRRATVHEVSDSPSAMVSLAHGRYTALVLVDPIMLPDAPQLASAVRRYHAGVNVWQFTSGLGGRLSPYVTAEDPQHISPMVEAPRDVPRDMEDFPPRSASSRPEIFVSSAVTARSYRSAGAVNVMERFDMDAGPTSSDDSTCSGSSVTLTQEELSLLLGEREPQKDGARA